MKKLILKCLAFITGTLFGILIALLGLSAFARMVEAATYNVFFNNVEQGANSHSNPTLSIAGGKPLPSPLPQAPSLSAPETATDKSVPTPSTLPEVAPSAGTTTAATLHPVQQKSPEDRKLRLSLLTQSFSASEPGFLHQNSSDRKWGGSLQATFFPIRDLGITAFGGWIPSQEPYYGGELEVVPLRLSVFGLSSWIEGALVTGVNTFQSDDIHAGAKITMNFGDRFGLVGGLRTNLTGREQNTYLLADAGLSVKF